MKRTLVALALVVGLLSGFATAARPDDIAAIDKSWGDAYVSCDAGAWDALLADDLVFIHNGGSIDDKAKQMASIKQCVIESLNSTVTKVRLYGNDTAVVTGRMQGKLKGRDFRFDLLYTRVYIRQKGSWRLVSHQSTDAPKRTS
ncbi:MAG TPA: nuclear transport factor 2 family protein [Vicinamibacterales bacterium]|jgi:ketosteroid isomerase-like protein|nr:nuclear transport factor 2 family protein [Vicinamibacterales bacterium]